MMYHGPLTRYVKLQVAHAPGMPGTVPPAADFKGNCELAIPACITARASRTCRDACRDRLPAVTGKTFPAFPAHAHPRFCVSGKRPILTYSYNARFFCKLRIDGLVQDRRNDSVLEMESHLSCTNPTTYTGHGITLGSALGIQVKI